MKKCKHLLALIMCAALMLGLMTVGAYAVKGDGSGQSTEGAADSSASGETSSQGSGESASATAITIPEGLADGTYTGSATVDHDDNEQFNAYPISVSVEIQDGAVVQFTVSGASGSNTQYSKKAEDGINEQMAGATAGTYEIDAVTMATCSSAAIVEGFNTAMTNEPSDTIVSLGEAVYNIEGTSFTVTVDSPEADTDYSAITVSYALGKFAEELEAGADYTVTQLSATEEQQVYEITILATSAYEIVDDENVFADTFNKIGQDLDVTVAGTSAGRVTICSEALIRLRNNALTLTGGNGETLADYIAQISEISVSYETADGQTVTDTYTTQWQHDTEPEYTPEDFFGEDGTVNLSLAAFANGASGTYTITVSCTGYIGVSGQVGGG